MVNTLSTIKGSPLWILFIEREDSIRVRLRSRGPAVNVLASNYKGGGHMLASGATVYSKEGIDKLLNDADLIIKEYKSLDNSSF